MRPPCLYKGVVGRFLGRTGNNVEGEWSLVREGQRGVRQGHGRVTVSNKSAPRSRLGQKLRRGQGRSQEVTGKSKQCQRSAVELACLKEKISRVKGGERGQARSWERNSLEHQIQCDCKKLILDFTEDWLGSGQQDQLDVKFMMESLTQTLPDSPTVSCTVVDSNFMYPLYYCEHYTMTGVFTMW